MSHIVEVPPHLSHSSADNISGAEEWRPAPRLEGYEVSSLGRVRSWRNRRGRPVAKPHLVGHKTSQGYIVVGTAHRAPAIRVHRLVCEAFHGPAPEGKPQVRHLNDVRDDNRAANLAWGDDADNMADKVRNGNSRNSPGPRKLSEGQVREIRARYADGEARRSLSSAFGVTWENINHIVTFRTWKGVV